MPVRCWRGSALFFGIFRNSCRSRKKNRFHIGPLIWEGLPDAHFPPESYPDGSRPMAVMSFGICCCDRTVAEKLLKCLFEAHYNVLIAAGGQKDISSIESSDERVRIIPFAPFKALLQKADLVISHGGQMTLFESFSFPWCPGIGHAVSA